METIKSTPRVFISSTFSDLQEYRDSVRDAVLVAGAMPVMIEYFPVGNTILNFIRDAIETADIILILVGYRYGTIISSSGKSFVEEEYELAEQLNKPIVAFMASEDVPWPLQLVDRDQTQIQNFRQRLASGRVVQWFRNPEELREKIVTGLIDLVRALQRPIPFEENKPHSVRQVTVTRLLLSSPGDVSEERDRVTKAVFRFNQRSVEEDGLFLKLIRWEDMAPQIGPRAQEVINSQIGAYDLFCGIMWNRFGTPTEIAASGTKEEFDGAVHCWTTSKRPWITFYFCDRPATFTTPEQLSQKGMVIEFRSNLHNMGIVRSFMTPYEFEELVYEDLLRITRQPDFKKMLTET